MTFQYHLESERSVFSWDDLAVSSSLYPDSFLWKCLSAATRLDVHGQLRQVERYDQILMYAFNQFSIQLFFGDSADFLIWLYVCSLTQTVVIRE